MSLINEALKRAEREKRLATGDDSVESPIGPTGRTSRSGRYGLIALGTLVLVALVVVTWFLTRPVPQTVDAAIATKPQPRPLVPDIQLPSPETFRRNRSLSPEAAKTYQKTVEAVIQYEKPVPPELPVAMAPDPAPDPITDSTPLDVTDPLIAVRPPAMRLSAQEPKQTPEPSEPDVGPAHPERSQPAEDSVPSAPMTRKPAPPTPVDTAVVKPDPRPIDPANYRLTGIMNGPDGTVVIINGFPVQLGDIVEDAKVVKIERHSVVLEVSGKNFRVRM